MIDLHKLRIFSTVARLSSFTRAADALHMTQPTVSQQLAMLEATLGAPLIERAPRHLRLTPAGTVLLEYAEKLLALTSEAAEATRAAAGLADRTLRLGAGHTLATYLLPDVLSRYRTQYPQHIFRITVGNTAELLAAVASDAIEMALVGSPADHPDVIVTPFMQDRLGGILGPGDVWAPPGGGGRGVLRTRLLLARGTGSALHAHVA